MAEMTAATIVSELRSEIAGFCTENLSDYMQVVRADLLDNAARLIEQQAAEIDRLRDLHRSILWFVEEHKKIPNCKKWMPLIEAKARQGLEKEGG